MDMEECCGGRHDLKIGSPSFQIVEVKLKQSIECTTRLCTFLFI